jgi:hypothetical protein
MSPGAVFILNSVALFLFPWKSVQKSYRPRPMQLELLLSLSSHSLRGPMGRISEAVFGVFRQFLCGSALRVLFAFAGSG